MKSKLFRKWTACMAVISAAAIFCGCGTNGIAAADAASSDSTDAAAERTVTGDVNCDGGVNLPDAVLTARAIAGYDGMLLTPAGKLNADVDRDGSITGNDLDLLLTFLSGKIKRLDPEPDQTDPPAQTTTVTETQTTPAPPESTTTTTTVAETTTTTVTTTTSVTVTETTTVTEAPPVQQDVLEAGSLRLPLGIGTGELIAQLGSPTEELVVAYESADMKFFIYASDPAQLHIAISADDTVVGYYALGTTYAAPEGCNVTEYIDSYSGGTGGVFAILAMKTGYTINVRYVKNKSDLSVLAKLNYYGVNGVRALNGVAALNWNEPLTAVALEHSREMADNDYFSHTSLAGLTPKERIIAAGISSNSRAENIDAGYTDPFHALKGWYTSEDGHRDNILDPYFTDIGVGFAYGADSTYKYYGTQDYIHAT